VSGETVESIMNTEKLSTESYPYAYLYVVLTIAQDLRTAYGATAG